MVTKRITFTMDSAYPTTNRNLEIQVGNFLMNWHYEDNFQEVLNMALQANNIPANVFKVGGPPDTLAFVVQPFPAPGMKAGRKLARGF